MTTRSKVLVGIAGIVAAASVATAGWVPNPNGGKIQFADNHYYVYESDGYVDLQVKRVGGIDGWGYVDCFTNNNSAVAPGDFTALPVHKLEWWPGQSDVKTVRVFIAADGAEPDEVFTVRLEEPTHAVVLGNPATATVHIISRDPGKTPSVVKLQQAPSMGLGVKFFQPQVPGSPMAGHELTGAGDTNGDGLDDFIISAPEAFGQDFAGRAYLIRGSANRYGGSSQSLSALGSHGTSYVGPLAANLGLLLSGCGDFNGDGLFDFVLGAHPVNFQSHLILGKASPPTSRNLGATPVAVGEGYRIAPGTQQSPIDAYPGGVLDFDNDGKAELLFAEPARAIDINGNGVWDPGEAQRGQVHVAKLALGQGNPPTLAVDDIQTISGAGGAFYGWSLTQYLGQQLGRGRAKGAGDFNGDGLDDLIVATSHITQQRPVGYYGAGSPAVTAWECGGAYIVYGGYVWPANQPNGVQVSPLAGAMVEISGYDRAYPIADAAYSHAGTSVNTAGDVNGDGFDDLLIGVPDKFSRKGEAHLLWGRAIGLADDYPIPSGAFELPPTASQGVVIRGGEVDGSLGFSVSAAGDFDRDGYDDVLVAAPSATPSGYNHAGIVYLIYGSWLRTHSTVDLAAFPNRDAGVMFLSTEGTAMYSAQGAVTSAGDTDGDGASDFLVGLPFAQDTDGTAWLIYGQPTASESLVTKEYIAAGDSPRRAASMLRDGDQSLPSTRCWIDYAGGFGPGNSNSSLETVSLHQTGTGSADVSAFGGHAPASVYWRLQTDRINYGSRTMTFQYRESELGGLAENDIALYEWLGTGDWKRVPSTVNATANRIVGTTTSVAESAYYAIGKIAVPTVAFERVAVSATEDVDSHAMLLVTLTVDSTTGPLASDLAVQVVPRPMGVPNEATLGVDYTAPPPIVFPAGYSSPVAMWAYIPLLHDTDLEPSETATFDLVESSTQAVSIAPTRATLTINDNDVLMVGFERTEYLVSEGEKLPTGDTYGDGQLAIKVVLNGPAPSDIAAQLHYFDASMVDQWYADTDYAISGPNFTPLTNTLVIPEGESETTLTFVAYNDGWPEMNEGLVIDLIPISGAEAHETNSSAIVKILDNDLQILLAKGDAANLGEGGNNFEDPLKIEKIPVKLERSGNEAADRPKPSNNARWGLAAPVTMEYAFSPGTARGPDPNNLAFTVADPAGEAYGYFPRFDYMCLDENGQYKQPSGTLTFAAGLTGNGANGKISQDISVALINDAMAEESERFTIAFRRPVGARFKTSESGIERSKIEVVINENDRDVLINETMTDPSSDYNGDTVVNAGDEFVEIINFSGDNKGTLKGGALSSVSLSGTPGPWMYVFPTGEDSALEQREVMLVFGKAPAPTLFPDEIPPHDQESGNADPHELEIQAAGVQFGAGGFDNANGTVALWTKPDALGRRKLVDVFEDYSLTGTGQSLTRRWRNRLTQYGGDAPGANKAAGAKPSSIKITDGTPGSLEDPPAYNVPSFEDCDLPPAPPLFAEKKTSVRPGYVYDRWHITMDQDYDGAIGPLDEDDPDQFPIHANENHLNQGVFIPLLDPDAPSTAWPRVRFTMRRRHNDYHPTWGFSTVDREQYFELWIPEEMKNLLVSGQSTLSGSITVNNTNYYKWNDSIASHSERGHLLVGNDSTTKAFDCLIRPLKTSAGAPSFTYYCDDDDNNCAATMPGSLTIATLGVHDPITEPPSTPRTWPGWTDNNGVLVPIQPETDSVEFSIVDAIPAMIEPLGGDGTVDDPYRLEVDDVARENYYKLEIELPEPLVVEKCNIVLEFPLDKLRLYPKDKDTESTAILPGRFTPEGLGLCESGDRKAEVYVRFLGATEVPAKLTIKVDPDGREDTRLGTGRASDVIVKDVYIEAIKLFDLDVDSDNDGYISADNHQEEEVEDLPGDPDHPGKILAVSHADEDADDVPSFADLNEDARFLRLTLTYDGTIINPATTSIRFDYSENYPQEGVGFDTEYDGYSPYLLYHILNGKLRVWTRPGSVDRTIQALPTSGKSNLVRSGAQVSLANLLQVCAGTQDLGDGRRRVELFVEAVDTSATPGDLSVKATLIDTATSAQLASETVRFTVIDPSFNLYPRSSSDEAGNPLPIQYSLDDGQIDFEAFVLNGKDSEGLPVSVPNGGSVAWYLDNSNLTTSIVDSRASLNVDLANLGGFNLTCMLENIRLGSADVDVAVDAIVLTDLPESVFDEYRLWESADIEVVEGAADAIAFSEIVRQQPTFVANGLDVVTCMIHVQDSFLNDVAEGTAVAWSLTGNATIVEEFHTTFETNGAGLAFVAVRTGFQVETVTLTAHVDGIEESIDIAINGVEIQFVGNPPQNIPIPPPGSPGGAFTFAAKVVESGSNNTPVTTPGQTVSFAVNNGTFVGSSDLHPRLRRVPVNPATGVASVTLSAAGAEANNGESTLVVGTLGAAPVELPLTFEYNPGQPALRLQMENHFAVAGGPSAFSYTHFTGPNDPPRTDSIVLDTCLTGSVTGQAGTEVELEVIPVDSDGFPLLNMPVMYRGLPFIDDPGHTKTLFGITSDCSDCSDDGPWNFAINPPFVLVTCAKPLPATQGVGAYDRAQTGWLLIPSPAAPGAVPTAQFKIEIVGDLAPSQQIFFNIKAKALTNPGLQQLAAEVIWAAMMGAGDGIVQFVEGFAMGSGDGINGALGDITAGFLLWGDVRDLAIELCHFYPGGEAPDGVVFGLAALGIALDLGTPWLVTVPFNGAVAAMKTLYKTYGNSALIRAISAVGLRMLRNGENLDDFVSLIKYITANPAEADRIQEMLENGDDLQDVLKLVRCFD